MKNILKEEDYLNQINSIIESDYIPDKKKMCLMSNLLEAEESGNTCMIKVTKEMLKSAESSSGTSLNSFLAKHTSEDNVSFTKIQEEHTKRLSEKF